MNTMHVWHADNQHLKHPDLTVSVAKKTANFAMSPLISAQNYVLGMSTEILYC